MQSCVSKHIIFGFLTLIAHAKTNILKPFGYHMCSNVCAQVARCRSFVVKTSDYSCKMRDNKCPREQSERNVFCRNVDKSLNGEANECSYSEKLILTQKRIQKCVRIYENMSKQKAKIGILFTYQSSRSFNILSSKNITSLKWKDVDVGMVIHRIKDFTGTKVLLGVRKPLSLIAFDIVSKEVNTILAKVEVYYTAQGETTGVVYFTGVKDRKMHFWKLSAIDTKPEKIVVGNLKVRTLEADQQTNTLYVSAQGTGFLFLVDISLKIKSKIPVGCRMYCSSMTMDRENGILFLVSVRRFKTSTVYRLVLSSKSVEKIYKINHCVQDLVFFEGYFYVSQREWSLYKLFRATMIRNKFQSEVLIYKKNERILLS